MTTPPIQQLPLAQLSAYSGNSRTHSGDQISSLATSLRKFGMVGAIVVRNGVVAKGHGTLAAINAIYAAGDLLYPAPGRDAGAQPYPAGTVPVLTVDGWSEDQFRAYVIADNRLGELSGWDMAKLASEVEELAIDADGDFDIADLGFDADAFAALDLHLEDTPAPAPVAKAKRAPAAVAATAAGEGAQPTADDYADIAQGATNPAEGKGIQYPLILQLDKPTFQRWRKVKGKRSDSEAIAAQLAMADRHASLLVVVKALEARGFFAESACADTDTAKDMAAMRDLLASESAP